MGDGHSAWNLASRRRSHSASWKGSCSFFLACASHLIGPCSRDMLQRLRKSPTKQLSTASIPVSRYPMFARIEAQSEEGTPWHYVFHNLAHSLGYFFICTTVKPPLLALLSVESSSRLENIAKWNTRQEKCPGNKTTYCMLRKKQFAHVRLLVVFLERNAYILNGCATFKYASSMRRHVPSVRRRNEVRYQASSSRRRDAMLEKSSKKNACDWRSLY